MTNKLCYHCNREIQDGERRFWHPTTMPKHEIVEGRIRIIGGENEEICKECSYWTGDRDGGRAYKCYGGACPAYIRDENERRKKIDSKKAGSTSA